MARYTQVFVAAAIALMAAFTSQAAHAGIPIPCTGEKLVKVADLPATAQIGGQHFDLGYKFSWCFSGAFVGYLGNSSHYLKSEAVDLLVGAGLIPPLPEAPGFWSAAWHNKGVFWVEWLWIGLIGLAGGAGLKNKMLYGTFAHPDVIAKQRAAAAAKAAAATAPSATAARAALPLPPGLPRAATPTFGRR